MHTAATNMKREKKLNTNHFSWGIIIIGVKAHIDEKEGRNILLHVGYWYSIRAIGKICS